LRHAEGLWYWNWTYTGEFMLQSTLRLSDCHKVDFIKHHDIYCSIGGCNDRGKEGDRAAGRIIAYILSRGTNIIDDPLITTKPKKALSFAVDRGLSRTLFALGASAGKLEGPLKTDVSVDAALRAATLPAPVFCIGGGELYALALPHATTLHCTLIDREFAGETRFPEIDPSFWRETAREEHLAPEGFTYAFVTFERRSTLEAGSTSIATQGK